MYQRRIVCPLYNPNEISQECKNCEYLKKAHKVNFYSRIGLIGALIIFAVTTCALW